MPHGWQLVYIVVPAAVSGVELAGRPHGELQLRVALMSLSVSSCCGPRPARCRRGRPAASRTAGCRPPAPSRRARSHGAGSPSASGSRCLQFVVPCRGDGRERLPGRFRAVRSRPGRRRTDRVRRSCAPSCRSSSRSSITWSIEPSPATDRRRPAVRRSAGAGSAARSRARPALCSPAIVRSRSSPLRIQSMRLPQRMPRVAVAGRRGAARRRWCRRPRSGCRPPR